MGKTADALAVVAVDHPHVTAAIAALRQAGKPSFALLSDLSAPQRVGYIGLDSRQCGRTAAWAVSRLSRRAGEVGVFVGSHRYLGHELAEISFRSYLREHAPQFRVLDSLVNLEDAQLAHEATLELLARQPDLVGIYVAGGGMPGIVRALRTEGATRDIVVIGNELTADNRAALIDGIVDLVIQTPLVKLAETAVSNMLSALAAGDATSAPRQQLLSMELFTPENFSPV
jgi:LacI family transcriptional regulator